MAQGKLQEFDEYRYGVRGVLKPGDKFRVGGGPVYVTDDGVEHVVAERGLFKFRRYCVQVHRNGLRHFLRVVAVWSCSGSAKRSKARLSPT